MKPTDPNEILTIIKSLKPKKSCSNDNLSAIILKSISECVSEPISIIINKSIESGTVPELMKTAKVIPIHKAKAKDNVSNYRPISILPTISKILEKVIHRRLYSFLQNSNTFYANQYGFRHKHSTSHAITKLISDIIHNMDKKKPTLSVFLDLSKAFDTINHDILLSKLEFYGIRGIALSWFKSYLSNRKQYVSYNGVQSKPLNMNCGVPQGSVLGPLLFIIYTNDLPDCINHATTILFADDTTIYESSADLNYLYSSMKNNLSRLTDWFRGNKLSLNVSKTNYMVFSNLTKNPSELHLQINDQLIEKAGCTKFLGIHIDDKLKWDIHISKIKSRLSSSLYAINKIKHFAPINILTTLYYSMVYPYLNYGITQWGATFKAHINKLNIMQKKIIRAIAGAKYNAHTNGIYHKLGILKLEDIYKLNVGKYMLSYMKDELPSPILNMYILAKNDETYQTRQNANFKIKPQSRRTVLASQSIEHVGPQIWNSIPNNIYTYNNTETLITSSGFASRYKRVLLGGYG
jgi:hypothetical protein